MKSGEPRSVGQARQAPRRRGLAVCPERVDWSAILEQRSLVADSEETNPVAVAGEISRHAGSRRFTAATAALFPLVAGAAVVFWSWQADRQPPAAGAATAPASSPATAISAVAPIPPYSPPTAFPPSASASSDSRLPERPTPEQAAGALADVEARIRACGAQNGVSGLALVKMKVEPDGRIAWSRIREGGDEFHRCVSRALHLVRLPATRQGGIVVHELGIPGP